MQFKDIRPNPVNPRDITKEQLTKLGNLYEEYGDLGILVFLKDGRIITGHQRIKSLKGKRPKMVVVDTFDEPRPDGTIETGYLETMTGKRYAYRVVDWTEDKADRATIIANGENGGTWNAGVLAEHWQFTRDEFEEMGVPDFVFSDIEETPPSGTDLVTFEKNKAPTIKITFKRVSDLKEAAHHIESMIEQFEGAYYSVSAGEA